MQLTFRPVCVGLSLFAGALSLLSGCIKVEQDLALNADGSGTFNVRYGMKQETIAQIEAASKAETDAGGLPAAKSPFRFNEADVRKDFAVYVQDGVTLTSFKKSDRDGWNIVELGMNFASLPGLMKTEFLADRRLSLSRDAAGNYVLEQRPDNPHVPTNNADNPAVQDMMREFMKGFRAAMTVRLPGDIIDSNGTAKGRIASWVFDLENDPQAIVKAQQFNMRVVFKGDGLNLPTAASTSRAKN